MSIQDVGSIGELVAAIATVVTLAYLALQIRGNTVAMKAESRRGYRVESAAVVRLIGGDPETADLFVKGLADPESLDPTARMRFRFLVSELIFAPIETAEREWRMGASDREDLDAIASHVSGLLETPGVRWYWKQVGPTYAASLRAHVDSLILDSGGDRTLDR